MIIDPQFPWWILANAIGGIVAVAVCAALRPVCRFITKRRTSTLRNGPDAERAKEELEEWANDLSAPERIEFTANLLLNLGRLRREIAQREALRPQQIPEEETWPSHELSGTDLETVIQAAMRISRNCTDFAAKAKDVSASDASLLSSIERFASPADAELLKQADEILLNRSSLRLMLTELLKDAKSLDQFRGHLEANPARTMPEFDSMVRGLYNLENILSYEVEFERNFRHALDRVRERATDAPNDTSTSSGSAAGYLPKP